MATAREDRMMEEDKLARLEEMVETLKRNQESTNVTVAAPPTRTLRAFSGRACELHDWMEDARNRLRSVPAVEKLPFLIGHLEGPAREEVRYAPEEEKDSVDKVFTLLLSTFGENRSNAQLKRELYDRRQRNRESVREFSRALLEISEGISDKWQSKNEMVIDVFCENLVDVHIKREMKRLVRGQSTISFSALRTEAIRLEEDGMGSSHENACVRGIQEPHHTRGEPSPLDRIAAQLELLATTQSEFVSLLRLQQQAPVGVVNPDKPEPRSGGAVCCEYCSRRGHTFARCWKRSSDRWRNGERSTNREYRGQSKGSTATNAMQCSQVGHPRYRPGRLNASGDGLSGKSHPIATTEVSHRRRRDSGYPASNGFAVRLTPEVTQRNGPSHHCSKTRHTGKCRVTGPT